jgi:uncharacterized repeat protein (TIGR01451 family)
VANQEVYISGDSGETWNLATNAPALVWDGIASSADGSKLVAVSDGGSIFSSADSGITWQSNNAPSMRWSSVASSANGNREVAAGNSGTFILPGYDLTIGGVASPPVVGPSNSLTFTFSVTNLGPEDATAVSVVDTLPTTVNFLSATPAWTSNGGTLTFNLGPLTNGAVALVTIQAMVTTNLGWWANSATVSSAMVDRERTNNSYSIPFGIALPGMQSWTKSPAPNLGWQRVACSADGTKLVAVAGYGGSAAPIYVSTNAGGSWSPTASPSLAWDCVASSADGVRLIAGAGYASPLYISTNAGATWDATSSGSSEWLYLASSADGRVLLAGDYGDFPVLSTNYGATWNNTAFPGYWNPVALSSDGSKLIAANEGALYTSTNAGATWTALTNLPFVLGSVACSADGNRLVAGPSNNGGATSGWIYISSDFGATWTAAYNGPNLPWVAVASSADGSRLFAAPYYYSIYSSSDSGNTWTMALTPGASWYSIASSADGNTAAALGSFGVYVSRLPTLSIAYSGANAVVSWPSPAWGFGLQQNADLSTTAWTDVIRPVIDDPNYRHVVINSPTNSLFFRLRQ